MTKTKIIDIDCKNIDANKLKKASLVLRKGGTVVFPTETVYGLGANALCEDAVKKIFKAKGRPSDNPIIVHISEIEKIKDLVIDFPENAKILGSNFWPGPLTMIFKKRKKIPEAITGGLDTVAIRIPSHPIARALIEMADVPVAAPSANLSGKPSPTKPQHVIEDMMNRVDVIISGGSCEVGVESTVLDVTTDVPMILRPGGITKESLEEIVPKIDVDPAIKKEHRHLAPKSPGMKYTHYSPKADVIVFKGEEKDIINAIESMRVEKQESGLQVGIMATEQTKGKYNGSAIISVGSRQKLETVANNLFDTLREFDKKGVDIILAEGFEENGIGQAIMNRLTKAAGYNVVEV
jgi:L-threonylcarbamoyladenylate synthase